MNSIRRQLTRELLGVFLFLLGGGLVAIYFAARDELIEQFNDALRAKALAISALTEVEGGRVTVRLTDSFLRGFQEENSQDFFELWSDEGKPILRSASLRGADLPVRTGTFDRPRFWNFELVDGHPGRAIGVVFQPKGDHENRRVPATAGLRLVVASDRENLDEALHELLGIGLACSALLVASTLWVIPRVLHRGLQPLHRLGEQAAQINAESLTARFPADTLPPELQPICARLNELLARLELSFERERRFSADLAHELRTPLAELRSLAECALKWPDTREATTDRETLAIATQMEAIVTNLLALARGERGQLACHNESVALATLAQEAWRPFAHRAAERQLRINFALAPAMAVADPALLRSILGNLFDNAVDYTPAGGEIAVTTQGDAAGVTLQIANATENLEAVDLPNLFDRFWRKEAARTGGQHVGLGLSLARVFAAAMGWKLSAALDDRHRLVFTLAGPAVV